jgi:hypothetical protein
MASKYEITFTPAICQGEGAEYEGTVTIRMPNYDERLGLYDAVGYDDGDDGEMTDADRRKKNLALMRSIARQSVNFVVAVDVTRKEDGFKFTSWDDCHADSDLNAVVAEVSHRLVGKHKLGNGSKAS